MKITNVTFPEAGACCMTAAENGTAYEAVTQQLFEKRQALYTVAGYEKGKAPRQAIEQQYGTDIFRTEALNHILLYEFPALQAQVCREQHLIPLCDPIPQLRSAGPDGFVVDCRMAIVPKTPLGAYTGRVISCPTAPISPQAIEQDIEQMRRTAQQRTGVLPQADDAFAASISAELHTMAQLRAAIREKLEADAQYARMQKAFHYLIEAIIADSEIPVPAFATDAVADARRENLMQQLQARNASLEQFLAQTGKNQAQLEADLHHAALFELQESAVLFRVSQLEGLEASAQEIEAEIARMIAISPKNSYARENPAAQLSIAKRLTRQKAIAFLESKNQIAD